MDLDAAALWYATRGEKTHDALIRLGVTRKLLNGAARPAWDFIGEYRDEHKEVPPAGIVAEKFGMAVAPPEEDEEGVSTAHTYVIDLLFERQQYKALTFGLGKAEGELEEGNQSDAVDEVLKLSDHLRQSRSAQLQVHSLADIAEDVFDLYERIERGEIGVPFPWEVMTNMTLGMWPGTLTFFVARPGVGKCVAFDTEIVDPLSGVPRTIQEVCEGEQAGVTSWSKEGGVHARAITAKVDTGHKECLRFTTRSGRSIVVTPEHPFLTPEGWRRADELRKGASVASPAKMSFPESPLAMDGAELDVLALLLSEGSYSGNHVGFSTVDPAILFIAGQVAEMMDVDLVYRSGYDHDFVRRGTGRHPVRELLRQLGIDRKIAKEKVIPDEVFRLRRSQLARFLTVFWMCDGTVSKRGDASITLASERMVRQIQSLLLRFGVQSRVAYRPIKGGFHAWRLRVYSHCADTFHACFALWGQKAERLRGPMERNPNVGSPRLSDDGVERLRELSRSGAGRWKGGLHEKVAGELGRAGFNTKDLFGSGNSIKMTAFRAFAAVYGVEDEYRWWWDSDIFWDEVESIDGAGRQKIYDLTVEPTSCFVANDLIVHNTWTAVLLAMHAWASGKKVIIVSPELGRVELGERMVAKHGRIAYKDMVSATLGSGGGKAHLRKVIDDLKATAKNLYILDNEEKLQPAFIEQAIQVIEPDLVIFDSIYMLRVEEGKVKKGPGSGGGSSKTDRMERLISTIDWMRSLSRREWSFAPAGLPLVGIHQLSREGKVNKEAAKNLKQGRGTGGMENAVALSDALFWNAHNLFAMYQDDYMRQDKQLLYVPLKVRRQAMASSLVIKWDMDEMNFEQIGTKVTEQDEYEDKDAGETPY